MYSPICYFNLCVLCYLLFQYDIEIMNMEYSILQDLKGEKSRKPPNFVLLCGMNFYIMPTQMFGHYGEYTPISFSLTLTKQLI